MMLPRIELGPRESESHVVTMLTIAPQTTKPHTATPSYPEKKKARFRRTGVRIKSPSPLGNRMGGAQSTPKDEPVGPYGPGFPSSIKPPKKHLKPTRRVYPSTRYGRSSVRSSANPYMPPSHSSAARVYRNEKRMLPFRGGKRTKTRRTKRQ